MFLKGARRVGKSTLAIKFGREYYKSFIEIRFDKAPEEIKELFVNSLEDLDYLFNKLQIHYKTRLYNRESLIILDEIQLFPEARQALKTLLEDKRYDYIETGSLASIKKKSKNILIPSEEYTLEVLPMDFEEFMWAMNEDFTLDIIKEHYQNLKPLGKINKDIMKKFREYILVGGMPQAVVEYVNTKDFGRVDFIKQNILNLYENDINTQEEENPTYVRNVFMHIPSELAKHDKQFVLSHINGARKREYEEPINWLNEAMIVNIAENVNDPSVAFNLSTIDPSFKCYMGDTGLLISHTFDENEISDNELYKEILLGKLSINEGMFYENTIAQMLVASGHKLFFYIKYNEEKHRNDIEIDFIVSNKSKLKYKIFPIEVKSTEKYSTRSLDKFKEKFHSRIGESYVIHPKNLKVENNTIFLPAYMAFCL